MLIRVSCVPVSRVWTRIVVHGPGPGSRDHNTLTLVGAKLFKFVFGGQTTKKCLNDTSALDLNSLKSKPSWESYESAPGNEKPLPRVGPHGLVHIQSPAQGWTAFKDIGSSPCGRRAHTMASDGGGVSVLGGELLPGAQVDEAKPIHVLDTKLLNYPKPDFNTVKHSEKATQLAQMPSAGHSTQGQPQFGIFSSSDAGAAHGALPFQIAPSEDMGRSALAQISRDRNPNLNDLTPPLKGASGRPRGVPGERDDGEGSTETHAKLVAPDAPSGKESARLEDGRLIELERQLLETLSAKTERDRRIAQLTDVLAQKIALLKRAEKEKKRARLELRELQAKLDGLLVSRDHALKQAEANAAAEEKKRAGLELRKLQAKIVAHEKSLLSRDHALQQAEANTAEEKERAGLELRKLQTKFDALNDSLVSRDCALKQAEANAAEERKRAGQELRKLQADLVACDEPLLNRDRALKQAEANTAEEKERSRLELRKLQAKLDESLVFRNRALQEAEANAAEEKERAGLELRKLQAKHDALNKSLQSRDHALQQAEENATEERKRAGQELRKLQAKLVEFEKSLLSRDHALQQAEAYASEEKELAGLELHRLQAKLDGSLLSRDHALKQARNALQKASCAAEANQQSQRELSEMRANLEASKSESAAFRLRLAGAENGCGKSKAKANTYRTQTATGLVNADEDRVVHKLLERMQAMEAEMASLRWNEKSFDMTKCRNKE